MEPLLWIFQIWKYSSVIIASFFRFVELLNTNFFQFLLKSNFFTVACSGPYYTDKTSYSAPGLQRNPRFGRNPSQHFTTFAAFGSFAQSNPRNFVPQTFEQKQTSANFGLEPQQHHFRGRVCFL